MSQQPDWTCFRKRIHIQKSISELYKAWATKAAIEQWFLEKADYRSPEGAIRAADQPFQKDDHFSWKWHNWNFTEEGRILEANGSDRVSFTFGAGGNVQVDLKDAGKRGTEVILTQDAIPTDEKSKMHLFVGCSTGWTFWMANLKAWLEHGITLHATGLQQDETADLVNS